MALPSVTASIIRAMSTGSSASARATGCEFLLRAPLGVHTPEDFDADVRLMADAALQFARGEVMPVLDRLDAQEEGLMMSLLKKACDLGFGAVDSPEGFGGLGQPKAVATRVLEMLSPNGSFATTMGVHSGVGQTPIALFGTDEQKRRYIPPLARGDYMGAYALSEPNSGSDALSVSCRATLTPDGANWKLNGTKMWISNAKWAGSFIVFAKVEGERFTAFIVEREHPGVSVSAEEHKMGLKGSSTARLVLDGAEIPRDNTLYEVGEGHRVALNTLNLGRCKLAAMALGQAREAIHQAAKYARERRQFGRSISEFGLIRDKLARMASNVFAAESMLYRTVGCIDDAFAAVDPSKGNVAEQNRRAAEEFAVECSLVKVFATEALGYCVDEAIQVHGGFGFTEEFPVARLYRDARVMRIYEGTNEINRLFAFNRLATKGGLNAALDAEPTTAAGALFRHAAMAATKLDTRTQQVDAGLSDLLALTYAQQSVISRADRMEASRHPRSEFARACADYFSFLAGVAAYSRAAEVCARVGGEPPVTPELHGVGSDDRIAAAVLEGSQYPL